MARWVIQPLGELGEFPIDQIGPALYSVPVLLPAGSFMPAVPAESFLSE